MKIHRNDNVLVISGKDKGKKGKVHRVFPESARVLVSGVNVTKRHTKARGQVRQAGIVEREAPISISDVMLVCGKCGKPSRVGYKVQDDKSKVRVCKACNEVID